MTRRHRLWLSAVLILGPAVLAYGGPPPPAATQPTVTTVPAARPPGMPQPTITLKPGELPGIKFDTPDYYFGRVPAGYEVVHFYWFTNTGTGPLEILLVRPSCGCTTASDYDRVVAPGEAGRIPIRLSTPKVGGEINKPITVYTNVEGPDGIITLQCRGILWQPVEVSPASVSFGRMNLEEVRSEPTRKVTVTNHTDERASLSDLRVTNPLFATELKLVEEGKQYELTVSLTPPFPYGSHQGLIELKTALVQAPTLQIPVAIYIAPDVMVVPATVMLSTDRREVVTRQLSIQNNARNPFRITGASVDDPLVVVEPPSPAVASTYRITIKIPPEYRAAPGRDRITIRTDHPDVPELTVTIVEQPPVQRPTSGPANPAAEAVLEPPS